MEVIKCVRDLQASIRQEVMYNVVEVLIIIIIINNDNTNSSSG